MKKAITILASLILFTGVSYAIQQAPAKTDKKTDKKEVKKVPSKKKTDKTKAAK